MEAGDEGVVVGEGTGFKSTEMGVAAEAEGKVAAEVEVEVEKEDNLGKVKRSRFSSICHFGWQPKFYSTA